MQFNDYFVFLIFFMSFYIAIRQFLIEDSFPLECAYEQSLKARIS